MIFGKLTYGGFDNLMSQKIQVENNLAFECCAKMVKWCLGAFQRCPRSVCGASKSV